MNLTKIVLYIIMFYCICMLTIHIVAMVKMQDYLKTLDDMDKKLSKIITIVNG